MTSSPPQFGQRLSKCCPQSTQKVHSKLQITASPDSDKPAEHFSHTSRISNIRSFFLRPHGVNETLVFIKQPAFAQLLVLHSVQQNTTHSFGRITEVFNSNQRTH